MAPTQIILFSNPRTACHLLERILTSQQTDIDRLYHPTQAAVPFINEWCNSDQRMSGMSNASDYEATIDAGVEVWKQTLEKSVQAERTLFVHTHPFYNLSPRHLLEYLTTYKDENLKKRQENHTLFPDSLLLHPNTLPIFTIRHPILLVPSLVRALDITFSGAGRDNFVIGAALAFSRELYDWYRSQGVDAVVADADDFITDEEYARHLAATVGLDPSCVSFSWQVTTEQDRESMGPQLLNIQQRLVESKGPEADRAARNVDLDAEREKWKSEFSDDVVAMIEELVEAAMPHYEYIREKRLKMSDKTPEGASNGSVVPLVRS